MHACCRNVSSLYAKELAHLRKKFLSLTMQFLAQTANQSHCAVDPVPNAPSYGLDYNVHILWAGHTGLAEASPTLPGNCRGEFVRAVVIPDCRALGNSTMLVRHQGFSVLVSTNRCAATIAGHKHESSIRFHWSAACVFTIRKVREGESLANGRLWHCQ